DITYVAGCGRHRLRDPEQHPRPVLHGHEQRVRRHAPLVYRAGADRTLRKNARTSSTSSSGCSKAAKWPPRGISVQRVMLKRASIHLRGDQMTSFGKSAHAVGTSI